MRQARPQGPPWCAQGSPAVWHSSSPCMAAPHCAASASAPCLLQKKRKGGILVLDARCDMHLIAAVSSKTHMSKRSACCTLARLAFAACPNSHVILVLLDLSRTYLAHHELESVAIIIVVIIVITCSCFHATLHISLLYHQKPLKFKTTVQYVKSKGKLLVCLQVTRGSRVVLDWIHTASRFSLPHQLRPHQGLACCPSLIPLWPALLPCHLSITRLT